MRHLLDTCNNRGRFANTELWWKRTRGCIETVAALVFCANVKLEVFGDPKDLGRLLHELIEIEHTPGPNRSPAGSDGPSVMRWKCLTFVTRYYYSMSWCAALAIDALSTIHIEGVEYESLSPDEYPGEYERQVDERALQNFQMIDKSFEEAREFCVYRLREVFRSGRTEEQVREVLGRDSDAIFSMFERVALVAGEMEAFDSTASEVNRLVNGLNKHLPSVSFDVFKGADLIKPIEFYNRPDAGGQQFMPQFLFLGQRLRLLCSYAPKLRGIVDGPSNGVYQEVLESLQTLWNDSILRNSVVGQQHLMERQLWRLFDLRESGGFGLSVELFFLVLANQLSMAPSQDTLSTHYIGTIRSIRSGWIKHTRSIGTLRVILNLICDIALPESGVFYDGPNFPSDITTELLILLENITGGWSSSRQHFEDAMTQLDAGVTQFQKDPLFFSKALELVSRLCNRTDD